MSALAVTSMIVVAGIVWGGFALLLGRAVRREAAKSSRADGRGARD